MAQLKGIVNWPYVVPNAPVRLGDVVVGRVLSAELADGEAVEVTIELEEGALPFFDQRTGESFFRPAPWEPVD